MSTIINIMLIPAVLVGCFFILRKYQYEAKGIGVLFIYVGTLGGLRGVYSHFTNTIHHNPMKGGPVYGIQLVLVGIGFIVIGAFLILEDYYFNKKKPNQSLEADD